MDQRRIIGGYVKAVGDDAPDAPDGWVEGIANAFEVDRYGDLILPEAMAAAFPKYLRNPVVSFGHGIDGNPTNGTLPAGKTLTLSILTSPLDLGGGQIAPAGSTAFRAAFAPTPDAQLVRKLYAGGYMKAFSIHFLPYGPSLETRQPTDEERALYPSVERVVTALELIEIALAVVPVNAGSLSSGAKSFNGGRLRPVPKFNRGAKAMNSILTGDQRKAVETAAGAYENHAKDMEAVKAHLEELSASPEGKEADHGAMCMKCAKAVADAGASHQALADSVKAMHVAITNQQPDGEADDDPDADPTADDDADPSQEAVTETGGPDDAGSPALPDDPEAKAFVLALRKGLSKV